MIEQAALQNRLLSRLSPDDFARLADELEFCVCDRSTVLWEADDPIEAVYFLESGLASIVARSPEGHAAEVGIIGREGFVYPSVALGSATAPFKVEIQMPGSAHRVPTAHLLRANDQSPTLRRMLLLFAHVHAVQATWSILSNAVHSVEERLARWLLMCHDRSPSDDLALTHNFIGMIMSVRRPSVTTSLHVLESRGFITSSRGYITIANRAALEAFAGDTYGKPEAECRRVIGAF